MSRSRAFIPVPTVDPLLLARARAAGPRETDRPKAAKPQPTAADGVATLRVYDPIDSWGGYWGVSAKEFAAMLDELPDDTAEIRLHLNSPGGDVFEGIAITNQLRAHAARVVIVVDGIAASIASVIAMAGDEVLMAPNSELMIHDAWGLCIGNAADMRKLGDLLDHLSDNISTAYARRAGGTAAEWRALMVEETWFSADEAVDAGLADRLAEPDKSAALASHDLSAFRFGGRASAPSPGSRMSRPAARMRADTKGSRMTRTTEGARVAGAVPAHDTDVAARTWDATKVLAALPEGPRPSQLRTVFAWVDPDGDPELAASYAYPHHHGVDGPANLRACVAGIARLNGAAGGPGVPEQDRQAVYEHLAAHVRDAGREPAPLNDGEPSDERFADHATRVLAEVEGLIESASRVVALRAGAGKQLSKANTDVLDWIGDGLERLKALCTTNPIPDGPSREKQQQTMLAAVARLNTLRGESL